MEPAQIPFKKLLLRIGLRIFLIVSLLLLLGLVVPPLLDLFLPFVLAFLAASMLAPLVRKFTKKVGKVWNFWSMLFVILLILAVTGILVYAGYYLFSQISDLLGSWQSIQTSVTDLLNALSSYLETHITLTSTDVEEYALDMLQKGLSWLTGNVSLAPSSCDRRGQFGLQHLP